GATSSSPGWRRSCWPSRWTWSRPPGAGASRPSDSGGPAAAQQLVTPPGGVELAARALHLEPGGADFLVVRRALEHAPMNRFEISGRRAEIQNLQPTRHDGLHSSSPT